MQPETRAGAVPSAHVLSIRVDATSYTHATGRVLEWAARGESRYVCVATVNNVMQAQDHADFREIMNAADLVTPDGMPLVWALRLFGIRSADRVYGPDLTRVLLRVAEDRGVPVGFYGGSQRAVAKLLRAVHATYPDLNVAYAWSPPFRPLTQAEDAAETTRIEASGAKILFIGLSTPKQERWMSQHRGRLSSVMIGVGAAFDFLSGTKPQAPRWMMRNGLEWLFRLISEPRRLWRRYLNQNPRFLALLGAALIRGGMQKPAS